MQRRRGNGGAQHSSTHEYLWMRTQRWQREGEEGGVCGSVREGGQGVHSALVNVRVLRNESLAIKTAFVFVDTCTRHESIVASNVPWVGKGQS